MKSSLALPLTAIVAVAMGKSCTQEGNQGGPCDHEGAAVRRIPSFTEAWSGSSELVGSSSRVAEDSRWRYLPIRACKWVSCQPSEYKSALRNVPSNSNLAAVAMWHDVSLCTEWCSSNR